MGRDSYGHGLLITSRLCPGRAPRAALKERKNGQGRNDQDQAYVHGGHGYFYVTKKNARTKTEKLAFKKYDPVARKHVEFKETKIK